MGLNYCDNNVREINEDFNTLMLRQDDHNLYIISKYFFQTTKKSLQFVPKGAVNYKSKLVQAMAWHKEDTKPLPESVLIQAFCTYMSLSDWLSWLLGKIYIHAEKNGTVWAHDGCLRPHSWKWAIPTPRVGSGRGTGWPYFVKSPLVSWLSSSGHFPCGPCTGFSPV